jgi:hypothetical protein
MNGIRHPWGISNSSLVQRAIVIIYPYVFPTALSVTHDDEPS